VRPSHLLWLCSQWDKENHFMGVMSRVQGRRATIFWTRVIAGCQNPALKSIRLEEPCSKHYQFCNGKFGSRSRVLKGALSGWASAGIINMESGAPLNVD
jgi:hypothetical protein